MFIFLDDAKNVARLDLFRASLLRLVGMARADARNVWQEESSGNAIGIEASWAGISLRKG